MTTVRTVIIGGSTDQGRVRGENQDCFGAFPAQVLNGSLTKGRLFIVADGMGGHRAGREASRLAVETLAETYYSAPEKDVTMSLKRAFEAANSRIYQKSITDPSCSGMGTTCTVLVLKDGTAIAGHIGDSRIYRITRRKVVQVTQDHSRVAELVRRSIITKEQARTHPERSQLYRALGTRPTAEVDYVSPFRLPRSCHFLLCTDGLSNLVDEDEMHSLVMARSPREACDALVELANERGGTDNITVQVIHSVAEQNHLVRLLENGAP
jgi:serine/threonine protein phosphatase PrpC